MSYKQKTTIFGVVTLRYNNEVWRTSERTYYFYLDPKGIPIEKYGEGPFSFYQHTSVDPTNGIWKNEPLIIKPL